MNKFKKVLSIISVATMSGMCILGNVPMTSVSADSYEFGLPIPTSADYQEYLSHYSSNDNSDVEIPGAGDGLFGASCDLSQTPYFPVIKNQTGGSCTSWSTTYYQFTFEANKLNNTVTTEENTYSPVFPFSFVGPAYNWQIYDFLKIHGSVKVSEQSLNSNLNAWCNDTGAMVRALNTRVSNDYDNYISTNEASSNLDYIKSLLYGTNGTNGKVLAVNTTDFYG